VSDAPLRHSPLDSEHRNLGAKMVDFGGWEMPIAYPSGTIAEHHACRSDAVAFDVSHLGTVRKTGSDAYDTLQRSLTNDLGKIEPGHAQYTHLLDENASVVDDIIIWWVDEDTFDVMPNASNTSPVTDAIGGDDVTSTRAIIAIQGPRAREHVETIFADAAKVSHFAVQRLNWHGTDVVVAGTGYTGEDGIEIAVPTAAATELWRAILESGVQPAGLGARDTLRLEAALPLHGHELGSGITPLQAGLGWVVSWDKGPFTGRSALSAEKERGVSRRMRGIVCEGRQPLRAESDVYSGDRKIGFVSSGNFSPVLGKGIALSFLDPKVKIGTEIEVDVRGRRLAGRVTSLPFVRRPKA
jgi:aminomethyltransferase